MRLKLLLHFLNSTHIIEACHIAFIEGLLVVHITTYDQSAKEAARIAAATVVCRHDRPDSRRLSKLPGARNENGFGGYSNRIANKSDDPCFAHIIVSAHSLETPEIRISKHAHAHALFALNRASLMKSIGMKDKTVLFITWPMVGVDGRFCYASGKKVRR